MKYVRNTRSPSRKNTLWPCHSSTPKSASKLSVMVYQGISQPIRAFRRTMVRLRCARGVRECGVADVQMGEVGDLIGPKGAAAAGMFGPAEHPGFEEGAVDDQLTPAFEQVEQARRARRPLERSTAIHGIRRRSAASASWARIWAFSFTSSCWRAASHFCGETIDGVCMASCPPFRSFSGDLVMVVATSELDELLGLGAEARLHRCRSLVVGHELTWHRGIGRWELQ